MNKTLRPAFNEYIRSPEGPAGIRLPETILSVYEAIIDHEARQRRSAGNGILFGGLFTSIMRNEKPRDIDIAICAPELVALALQLKELRQRPAEGYKEYKELREQAEDLKEMMFPYGNQLHFNIETMTEVRHPGHIDLCFHVTGTLVRPDYTTGIDVTFLATPVDARTILSYPPDAPIRSIGYECDTGTYVYHRDFEDHARRWVYEPFEPSLVRAKSLQKAREKGMTILMP